MTNRIALVLAIAVGALIAVDLAMGLGASLFLARRFLAVVDWLAFWR